MRYIKIAAWTVLVSLGTLIVLTAVLITFINNRSWDIQSKVAIRSLEGATGLTIDRLGYLKIHIGRTVSVQINSLAMHAKNPAQASVVIGQVQASMALRPILFNRRLLIQNLELADVRICLDEPRTEHAMRPEVWSQILKVARTTFVQSAHIRNVLIIYNDKDEKESVAWAIDDLVISPSASSREMTLTAGAALGSLPVQLKGTWGSQEKFDDIQSAFPLVLRLNGGDRLHLEVKGQINPGRTASHFIVNAPRIDPNPFIQALRLEFGPLPAMSLAMEVVQSENHVEAQDFAMWLGSSQIVGSLMFHAKGNRPMFNANLRSPSLRLSDVRGLLGPWGKQDPESPNFFSRDIFPLATLRGIDANIQLKVPALTAPSSELMLHDVNLGAILKDQKLTVNPFSLALAQGRIMGTIQASLDKDPMETELNLDVRSLQLENALQAFPEDLPLFKLKASELIKGRLIGTIELRSRGQSFHELASNATGRSQFAVEDGQLSKAASEAFGFQLVGTIAGLFKDRPFVDLQCMISSFAGHDGLFKSQAFVMSTPDVNIEGHGAVDLGQETIQMTLETKPRKTVVGAVLLPIRVSGPLTHLSIELGQAKEKQPAQEPDQGKSLGQTLAGILPFVEPGDEKESACRRYLATLSSIRTRSQAGPKGPTGPAGH
ncbi:MAG TPA: AsmA-like C-terminal region-containing protein [Oligoflexus sp.]|uniref:AsmA family protein n=1 Tax=Oligoflexus sp. TaxID=1971216 RepID=UPI002D4B1B9F|nr:AsmA-like C-terminal region-containing protein [Oligoflexus sp.]HYX39334.1 AsmA-like C-terminal region-containing protein [Oligoflexus sp.]